MSTMPDGDPPVSHEQMKAAIGSLVFLWSRIERELTAAIRLLVDPEAKVPYGPARLLDCWSKAIACRSADRPWQTALCDRVVGHLRDALGVRNFICHGLVGVTGQRQGVEPFLTVELGAEGRVVTWRELQEMFDWMSRTELLVFDLTHASLDDDVARSDERLRAWKDFPRLA